MDDYVNGLLIQLNDSIIRSADQHGTSNAPVAKWTSLVTGIILGMQERIDELEALLAKNGMSRG